MSVRLVVTYDDNAIMYYPIPPEQGWKVDASTRCLVVGRGLPRTHIPLDRVRSFDVEQVEPAEVPGPTCFKCGRADGEIVDRGEPYREIRFMHAYGNCATNGRMT